MTPADLQNQIAAAFEHRHAAPRTGEPNHAAAKRFHRRLAELKSALASHVPHHDTPALALFVGLCLLTRTDPSPRRLLAALPVTDTPFATCDIVAAMANLGFHVVQRRAPFRAPLLGRPLLVMQARGAAVLFTGRDDVVRLFSGAGEVVDVSPGALDPAAATAFEFVSDSEEHSLSRRRREHTGHGWFRALLARFAGLPVALVLTSLLLAAITVLVPMFSIAIYAQVITLGTPGPLTGLATGMAILIAAEILLLRQRTHAIAWMAARLEYLVGTVTFGRILTVPPPLSERVPPTDQASRLQTFENVRDFLTGPTFPTLLDIPAAMLALATVAYLAGTLVMVPLFGICGHLVTFLVVRHHAAVLTRAAADEATEMQRLYAETFEKRMAIRDAGLQTQWLARVDRALWRDERAQIRLRMVGSVGEAVSSCVLSATLILFLSECARIAWTQPFDLGTMLAVTMLSVSALTPFHIACLSIPRFEQMRNSIRQIETLMETPTETIDERDDSRLQEVAGTISLLNLGFRSGDTRPVFYGLDLEIDRGDVIAIAGANGTGKSTLLKMLQGLADISLGAVRMDGVDLRQLELDRIRRSISYVPQHPKLLPGSRRDNLAYANPLEKAERVRRVLEIVGLSETIDALSGGLDYSPPANHLEHFSAEFLFRFALAQALITNGNIILIDEVPNSLCDSDVGALIKRLIAAARRERTLVFATHRTDFISLADRVVLLRYGKVPIISTPRELLTRAA